jgi:hypothetical protein
MNAYSKAPQTQPAPRLVKLRQRKSAVARPLVAALANLAADIDTLKGDFPDAIDKAALREAVALMHDVAISHDDAGGYGLYAPEEPTIPRTGEAS